MRSANDAVKAFETAYEKGEAVNTEMKAILQSRPNFLEAADAQLVLNRRMAAYSDLGQQLREVLASISGSGI